jgi:hypothetical protein
MDLERGVARGSASTPVGPSIGCGHVGVLLHLRMYLTGPLHLQVHGLQHLPFAMGGSSRPRPPTANRKEFKACGMI